MAAMAVRRQETMQSLASGRERATVSATRAAETRCRSTNHISATTQFLVKIGELLENAEESSEDITKAVKDLYHTAMTNLTAPFGRILPSNRCVERSIFDLHGQIKQLVGDNVIPCLSDTDPVLMGGDLPGQGALLEPKLMLPPYEEYQEYSPAPAEATPMMPALTLEQTEEVLASVTESPEMSHVSLHAAAMATAAPDTSVMATASALALQEFDFM